MRKIMTAVLAIALCTVSAANEETETLIREAMDAAVRTQAEKDRDVNRKPVETLAFFGLTRDMKVLELIPGGGWYTKLLAPTLAADGDCTWPWASTASVTAC